MLDGLKTKYPFTPTGTLAGDQPLAGLRISAPLTGETALSTPAAIAPKENLLTRTIKNIPGQFMAVRETIGNIPGWKQVREVLTPTPEQAKEQGLLSVGRGTYLDPLGAIGGMENVIKTAAKQLAKETSTAVIKPILQKLGIVSDEVVSKVAKTTKPAEVESILKSAIKPVIPEFQPLAQEAQKYKSAEVTVNPYTFKEEKALDWSPLVNRQLFDLDVAGSGGRLKPEKLAEFKTFLKENPNKMARLYHATDEKIPILQEGLKPTGRKTATSLGTSFGRVSLGYDPRQVVGFPDIGYPYAKKINVYAVDVPIRDLVPDVDQLRNKRLYGENKDIGGTLADSLIYGGGAQVKGKIPPSQIKLFSIFDKETGQTKSQLTDFYNQAVKGREVGAEVKTVSGLPESKNIPQEMPEVPPPLSPNIPLKSEELSSVQKITQALKESKPLRGKQEALYSAERSQRMAKALAVGEKTTGEAGYFRELGQLKGELPKVQFDEIRSKIGQTDIDNLFSQIKDSKLLSFWDSVNARGGLVKVLEGRVPTEGELTLLGRVFPKEFIETILSKRDLFTKFKDAAYQLANIPRSVMASFDLSAPFRQGLFLISHPKRFFGSFVDMFKAFGSENAFKAIQEDIVKKPTFELMRDNKLALTEMDSILTQREEKFMSSWAEKIPLVGKVIRASGRAYTGFLNKLRADVFDDLITKADKLGLAPRSNPQLTKEIANFVNVASGRGSLGSLQPAANALNSFFFSPKLMSSRLTLLNPGYYIKAEPFVRREAIKSLLTVLGVGSSILGLSKLAGADVGTDPRSADFGKIIVGKTRLDVWGGFQQYIRMFGQLLSGQYVSSVTGKLVTLGEGYKPLTRFDILQRQIEAKEAPIFSFITTLLKGQNFLGEKIKLTDEIKNRFIPMAISDIYDIYKNDPELLPISGAGMFGFGLQTYSEERGPLPSEKEKKQTYEISQILGEQAKGREELSNASNLMYQELKKLPKEQAAESFDRLIKENPEMTDKINDIIKDEQLGLTYVEKMLKQLGVENGQRAEYIVKELSKLSKEEKKSYYQNLIDKKVITKEVSKQILKLLHQ